MKPQTLKKIRMCLGRIFFLLITLMFLDFTGTLHHYLAWMAKIQFLPAVMALNFGVVAVLIVLTLIFGRVYCSIICPLGVMQDIFFAVHIHKHKNSCTYSKAKNILRYSILALFIIAMILGANSLVALLSPYSSYGRIAQNLLQPIYIGINNILAFFAEKMNSYAFYSKEVWIRSISTFVIALLTFIIIGFLAARNGRTYCNTICPVGSVLGFLSRFSWLKINIDTNKCIKCNKCTKNCKASCINGKENIVDYSRCVVCGDCMAECPKAAINYSHHKKQAVRVQQNIENKQDVDTSKRAFLFGAATMITTVALAQEKKKVDGGIAVIEDKIAPKRDVPIIPPGAKGLKVFYDRCTGCQLCVSKCPNNVLRPSNNIMHLMQPEMSYEKGACRVECTACSDVCPTGAIEKIAPEDKTSIQIGHAEWIKKNCVTQTDKVECGNCARHCPAGAIMMVPQDANDEDSIKIPAVNESRCIGCGMCEFVCPSRPYSAIFVQGHEDHKTI